MPWTLVHPAAIVPLRRAPLNFAALVLGSMTPDLGYYIDNSRLSTYAHTFRGSFIYDVLPGLVLYAIYLAARRPVCFILPMPHRGALWPLCERRPQLSLVQLAVLVFSLFLGAWTHIIWDSFTHRTGWFVQEVPVLRQIAIASGVGDLAGYVVLQHLSTLTGFLVLAFVYCRWLRRQTPIASDPCTSERWRYAVCLGLFVTATVLALLLAFREQAPLGSYRALRLFVFSCAINLVTVGAPLLLLVSALVYAWRGPRHASAKRGFRVDSESASR